MCLATALQGYELDECGLIKQENVQRFYTAPTQNKMLPLCKCLNSFETTTN
jgi:hypothetical protein